MPAVRTCRVTLVDPDGVAHATTVAASSLFEAAAAALAAFRQEAWADAALTPNARLRIEVQLPPVVHDVPLTSVERWVNAPSRSPRERVSKRSASHVRDRDVRS